MRAKVILTLLCTSLHLYHCADEEASDTANSDLSPYESEILELINSHRRNEGLQTLKFNSVLQKEAANHSLNMAEGKIPLGHAEFETRRENVQAELGDIKSMAENVAQGQFPATEVLAGWLNSRGHKENIEGDYSITGLSAQQSSGGEWYYTQIFARQ